MTAAVALLALLAAEPGDDWRWGGPPRYAGGHPFGGLFLSTPALDAALPRRPAWDFRLSQFNTLAISPNVFTTRAGQALQQRFAAGRPAEPLDTAALAAEAAARPGETFFFADGETTRLDIVYYHPFDSRWAVEVELPLLGHWGGWFDPLIEGFHAAFNFPDLYRGLTPDQRVQLFAARGGQALVFDGPLEPGLGDLVLRGLHAPVPERSDQPAVALSASLKLPTGAASRLQGSGRFDFGLGWHVAKSLGDVRLYLSSGYTWHGGWRGLTAVPLRPTVDLHLGTEIRFSRDWSANLMFSRLEHALAPADPASFGKPALQIAGGFRWQPATLPEMSFWFFENLNEDQNSYDAGIQYRMRWVR